MQTDFSPELLENPAIAESEKIIRKCVHCGFCTATCPTYVLLGDELDSPRGRIYLIKDMLENQAEPTSEVVKHIDRCLSCLSCMTTCPSGVNYMHLVDHARAYIEKRYRRPWPDRIYRAVLAAILPNSARFRLALSLARFVRPLSPLFNKVGMLRPLSTMIALAPRSLPRKAKTETSSIPQPIGRVILLQGCAEPVLRPEIREATKRVLNRAGYEVVFAANETCCGALVHHMGKEEASLSAARRNVVAWSREIETTGIDAIVITASGCGTTIKDYGHMLRDDFELAEKAARISTLAKDLSELLAGHDFGEGNGHGVSVAYHAACSLQHGQKVTEAPKQLLERVGFCVRTASESHLCCGSAGTYNILQPVIADQLGARKVANLERLKADVIATGNIGCAIQIGRGAQTPVVHTVELLDWATGGPIPQALRHLEKEH